MDYVLVVTYNDGHTERRDCPTLTDVSNFMHGMLHSADISASRVVSFQVIYNG